MKHTVFILAFSVLVSLWGFKSEASNSYVAVSCQDRRANPQFEVSVQKPAASSVANSQSYQLHVKLYGKTIAVRKVKSVEKAPNQIFISSGTYGNSNGAPTSLTLNIWNTNSSGPRAEFSEVSYLPDLRIPSNIATWNLFCSSVRL